MRNNFRETALRRALVAGLVGSALLDRDIDGATSARDESFTLEMVTRDPFPTLPDLISGWLMLTRYS